MWGTVENVHHYGAGEEIVNFMTGVYVYLELIVVIVGPIAVGLILWQKMFNKFPGCFFKWMLYMDILAAFYAGPLRWYQNMAMASMGYPADATGCQLVAFGDTFFHVASLVMNTFVVSCIFYMVYFKSAKFSQSKTQWMGSLGAILGTALLFALFSFNGPVDNFHGWCTMDSSGVVLKLLFMCLLASVQITLVIPTLLAISATSAKSRNTTSTVMMMSFVGIIVCQLIGTIPLIVIEYVGYARIVVPFFLKEIVLIGVPLARMVNIGLVLYKVAVKTIPALQSKAKGKDLDKVGRSITSGSRSENSLSESDSRGSRLGAVSAVNYDQPGAGGTGLLPGDRSILEDMSLDQGDDETTREESTSESRSSRSSRGSTSSKKSRTGKGKNAKGKKQAGQKGDDACKIPFKYLLAVVILIPVTLQSIAVGFVYNKQSHDYNHAHLAEMNVHMMQKLSNFLHEAQAERDASAIFLGSGGKEYKEKMEEERHLLDARIKDLQYFVDKEYDDGAIMTNQEFAYGLGQMYLIPRERSHIDSLDFTVEQSNEFYNSMIEKFLHVVQAVAKNQGEDSSDVDIYATFNFLFAEEKMADERAMASNAFADGKWHSKKELLEFIDITTQQEAARKIFEGYAHEIAINEYKKVQKGDVAQIAKNMRMIAYHNDEAELVATDSQYWFEIMTRYIDQVWDIQTEQQMRLEEKAQTQLDYDLAVVIDVLIITTASLVLCGLVGLVVSQAVIGMRKKAKVSKSKTKGWRGWFDHETHLLVHCLWCVFILFILMTLVVQDETIKLRSASILMTNMHLKDMMVQVMYHSQLERGMSALYLGSHGKLYGKEMAEERKLNDKAWEYLDEYLLSGEYSLDYILNSDEFNKLIISLRGFDEIRAKIDKQEIDAAGAVHYFDDAIWHMFHIFAQFITDDTVVYGHLENNMMYGYMVTMFAKETIGRERAAGGDALVHNGFVDEGHWREFVAYAKQRDAYFKLFKEFAPKAVKNLLQKEEDKEDNKMLMEWEESLKNQDFEQCISADYWFRMMTRKMNGVRDIEERQANDLLGLLDGVRADASMAMGWLIFSLVVSLISGIVVYVRVRLNMIKQKKRALIPLTPSTNSRGGKFNPEEQCIKCKNDLYCPRCYERSVERLMGNEVPVIKKIEDTVPVTKKAAPGPGEEEETAPLMTKEVEVEMTK